MWTKSARAALVTVVALGAAGLVAAAAPDASAATITSTFHAVTPTRLLDTRHGIGAPQAVVGAGKTLTVTVTGTHGGAVIPSNATSVVLNVTVDNPTSAGYIIVFARGASVPKVSSLNFVRGQTVPNLVIAPVASGGVALVNGSAGTVNLIADISGYYAPSGGNTQGTYASVTPTRLLDTRFGTGAPKAAVLRHHSVTFTVTGGAAKVPAGVSAVALNITAVTPTVHGFITAFDPDDPQPTSSNLNFGIGQTVPNLAIVPVSASGQVELYNGQAAGSVELLADIQGYFVGGDPISAGALGALAPERLLDTRVGNGAPEVAVAANQSVTFHMAGRSGVPISGVTAAVVNVTVTSPTAAGFITAYSGPNQPGVSNLNFVAGQTVANLAIIGPLASDTVTLFNNSPGTVELIADVSGYVLGSSLPLPATSKARYVRNLHTAGGSVDLQTMQDEGCDDAASPIVVLDIGAQLNDELGVELSATGITLNYAQLATDLSNYLASYRSCGSGGAVAIATSNSADFTTYTATQRGADWANKVLDAVTVPSGVTVYGADDIEAGFAFVPGGAGSTEAQSEQWVTAYLGATTHNFVYIGSADGCPTTYGTTGATCSHGWTQANYYALSRGLSPSRITALPQIYTPALAVQWADIAETGDSAASIVGALTEHAACPTATSAGCTFASLTPGQGWAALAHALSTQFTTVTLPYSADLQSDTAPE